VSVDTWEEAVEHAQRLAQSVERKASAQRSHFTRRLAKMAVKIRGSTMTLTLALTLCLTLTPTQTRTRTRTLTCTRTRTLKEEADKLRFNVLTAEAKAKTMGYNSNKVARGADVAQQVCFELLANAQLLAESHQRISEIKRRAYDRHVKGLQVLQPILLPKALP
jgi:hypothetical protein